MKITPPRLALFLAIPGLLASGCSSEPSAFTEAARPPELASAANISLRILQLDAQVKPVTPEMTQTLNQVMADACAAIAKLHRTKTGRWDRPYAEAALKCIDDALIDHGFLYPNKGGVDLLADALTPFQMSASQKTSFQTQPHNRRRASMIAERFPGPFHVVDCDTASFIYLGVADQLHLPLHLAAIPAHNRAAGHTFVRWREGSHFIDWETMDGIVTTDSCYQMDWKITPAEIKAHSALADLTATQVIGCEHYLLAVQYERRGNYQQALRELSLSLQLYSQNLDARAEFAWDTATAPALASRDNAQAIEDAQFVLGIVDDPDVRDTLAAAYASGGLFDLAAKEETAALLDSERSPEAKPAYQRRLLQYQHHVPFRQSASPPDHGDAAKP